MALITCPECGKENVSDIAEACPSCGYPISKNIELINCQQKKHTLPKEDVHSHDSIKEVEQREIYREKDIEKDTESQNAVKKNGNKKKNKARKIIWIFLIMGFVAIWAFFSIYIPSQKYKQANALYEEEKYLEALSLYEELDNYKDSSKKIEACELGNVKLNVNNGINLEESLEYLRNIQPTTEIEEIKKECYSKLIQNNYSQQKYWITLNYIEESGLVDEFYIIQIDCLWQIANNEYDSGNYGQVIQYIDKIGDLSLLEHDEEMANEILYDSLCKYGTELYNEGDFGQALVYLGRLENQTEKTAEYIEKATFYEKLQGKWLTADNYAGLEYNGWEVFIYSGFIDAFGNLQNPVKMKSTNLKDYLIEGEQWSFNNSKGRFLSENMFELSDDDFSSTFIRVEKFQEEIPEKLEPQVGMTAAEVKESTWGEPQDINKSTYSWGVKEQWCYSGYRYIYLEDGIVTSISE